MRRFFSYNLAIVMVCVAATVAFSVEAQAQTKKPNILVIWGDDVGITISVPTATA